MSRFVQSLYPSILVLGLLVVLSRTPVASSSRPYMQGGRTPEVRGNGNSQWLLHFYKRLLKGDHEMGENLGGGRQVEEEEMEYGHNSVQCLARNAACNPWRSRCCDGLECLSYTREMCMNNENTCACFPASYRMRQVANDLWYRRRR